MPVEKETKIEEVVAELRKEIMEGVYPSGQRLPSERDIADNFEVSRVTVRSALLRLQSENLVDIVPRGGAFVRSVTTKQSMGKIDSSILAIIPDVASGPELIQAGSFIRAMKAQGKDTQVRFIEPSSIIKAGDEISEKMGITQNTDILRRYRVHLVDRIPYRILDSYYLESLLGGLLGKRQWLHSTV